MSQDLQSSDLAKQPRTPCTAFLLISLQGVHTFYTRHRHTKQSHLFVISWDGAEEEGVSELVAQAVGGGSIADLRDFQVRQDTSQVNGAVAGVGPHIQVNLVRTDHLSHSINVQIEESHQEQL